MFGGHFTLKIASCCEQAAACTKISFQPVKSSRIEYFGTVGFTCLRLQLLTSSVTPSSSEGDEDFGWEICMFGV